MSDERQYTVRSIYDIAIKLIDSQNESTGATETKDNKEYMLRTPELLNSVLDEAFQASDRFDASEGGRPIVDYVSSMSDTVDMEGAVCKGLLPYALAGLLLSEENPTLADFFWQSYQEKLAKMKSAISSVMEDIENPYGGIEYGEFTRW